MTNFLTDNTALPFPKANLDPLPGGALAENYLEGAEWNTVCQAMIDVRNFLRAQVPVNLRAVGCIPRDSTAGATNVGIINSLLSAARASSRPITLKVDDWFYIDKAGTNWSIRMEEGTVDQWIVGNGRYTSGFIQNGAGTGNDWFGVLADRTSHSGMMNVGMYQGEIGLPSTGQHDHLLQIANFGGASDIGEFSAIGCYFGKALGDCINFYGGDGIVRANIIDVDIDGWGFVLKQWTPSTSYAFGAMVRNGASTLCYYQTNPAGGISAALPSTGPSGSGSSIADGTCTWSTEVPGATFRKGARSGLAFQRGYDGIMVNNFRIRGVQNSLIDQESTGVGTCRHCHFSNGDLDNGTAASGKKGNTGTIFSFSGSNSLTNPAEYSSVRNVTLRNGSMQIAETRNARVSNVRIVQTEAPAADTGTANIYTQRDNDGLVLDSLQLHRIGTSAPGELFFAQGTGKVTLSGAWICEQGTSANVIGGEPASDFTHDATFNVKYSGAAPSTKSVFSYSAIPQSVDRLKIRGVSLESTTGAMKALLTVGSRAFKAYLDIAPLTTNCETVVQAKLFGPSGNAITLAFVADGTGAGSLTEAGTAVTFHYQSGVTTVANFETAVAGSTLIEVLTVDGVGTLTAPDDTFAATALTNGKNNSVNNIMITENRATAGSLLTGCYLSKQAGTIFDPNPIIQNNDFGPGVPLITSVDISDAPISTIYPLIAGNKNGPYTLTGTVDPTNNVKAPQGTTYIWTNGDSTKWYVKAEGTGTGGWAEVTHGTPSLAPFIMPTDATSWDTHRLETAISDDWENPDLWRTCQEAAGDLAAGIGSIDLVAAGTPAYQVDESARGYPNASPTWAVGMGENDADSFTSTNAGLPDAQGSLLGVWIGRATATPAAPRSWLQLTESHQVRMQNTAGRNARVFAVGNDGVPPYTIDDEFHVWWFLVDETNNVCWFGNEEFKHQIGYVSQGTAIKRFGAGAFDENSAPFNMVRIGLWSGAKAVKTLTQIKALIESFGAGVLWLP